MLIEARAQSCRITAQPLSYSGVEVHRGLIVITIISEGSALVHLSRWNVFTSKSAFGYTQDTIFTAELLVYFFKRLTLSAFRRIYSVSARNDISGVCGAQFSQTLSIRPRWAKAEASGRIPIWDSLCEYRLQWADVAGNSFAAKHAFRPKAALR